MNRDRMNIFILLIPCLVLSTTGCATLTQIFDNGAGAGAQFRCSNVFISGRSVQSVEEQEACLECRMGDLGALWRA